MEFFGQAPNSRILQDILEAALVAEAFQPVYWVLRDRKTGCLVVTIRGTFSMSDIISDVYLGGL